jgi:hypothetical protein
MTTSSGLLRKMITRHESPVAYCLRVDDQEVPLNDLIGQSVSLDYSGEIRCINCGRRSNRSFNQGFCYPCSQRLAQCDLCILRPERCHYHLGTCREPDWGEANCMQPHWVYLANTSGLKVGITRFNQIPTRWMDQGAVQALPIFKVSSRLLSGLIETAVGKHVADKTNWRKMLKGETTNIDLAAERDRLLALCSEEIDAISSGHSGAVDRIKDVQLHQFEYPVSSYPEKIISLNLDKNPSIEDTLVGIKGQYLYFSSGVINIRKYTGYHVEFNY